MVWTRLESRLIKKVLVGKLNKTRPLGIPRTRWIDVIARDLKEIDQNVACESTYNRDGFKAAIVLNGSVS